MSDSHFINTLVLILDNF